MIIKNNSSKIAIVGLLGMVFLTQPAKAYVSPLGWDFELPAVKVAPTDGAAFVVSSVPVEIRTQVSKNIFAANIPNDKGGVFNRNCPEIR